jgi:Calcium-dependent channel, 7TM region, putative phosphate/Extracellular tail, of 10TM putative phosphate transporter
LILIIGASAFGCFWLIFRYNFFYILKPEVSVGGRLYPRALFQLFTGLYVLEICLIGLFALIRDGHESPACLSQAGAMIAVLILTVLFHRQLQKVFCPLFESPLMTFGDSISSGSYISALDSEKVFEDKHHTRDLNHTQTLLNAALGDQKTTVWIPKDDLGVSDDEIKWSRTLSQDIVLSNAGARIDKEGRVVYNQDPPFEKTRPDR